MGILPSIAVFAVTMLTAFAFAAWRKRRWGERVLLRVDPDSPVASDIAGYFREIAVSLDERPRRLRLVLDGRNNAGKRVALDFGKKGNMAVFAGDGEAFFSLRGRWIPDHPLPLVFSSKTKTLFVAPVDANRFRVMSRYPFRVPRHIEAIACIVATAGVLSVSLELISFSLAVLVCANVFRR